MPSSTGVFLAARIIRRDTGEEVPLWTPDRPFLTSVEVELGLALTGKITATLDCPYKAGIKFLEEPGLCVQSNTLKVRIGYSKTGHMTPWFWGLMKTPGCQIDANGVQLTLEAQGGVCLGMTRLVTAQFQGTVETNVRALADRYGWGVEIDDPSGLQDEVNVVGANNTVWTLLKEMLVRVGYGFYVINDDAGRPTLRVLRNSTWTATAPKRTLVLFGKVDLAKNQYPLLSFSCDAPQVFFWRGSAGYQSLYLDEDGNVITVKADASTSESSVLGEESAASTSEDQADSTGAMVDVAEDDLAAPEQVVTAGSDAEAEGALQAEYDRSSMTFEATATTLGIPLMFPGEVVKVQGCSKLYDGSYGVWKTTHRAGSDGYETEVVIKRNAFPEGFGTTMATQPSAPTTAEESNEMGV